MRAAFLTGPTAIEVRDTEPPADAPGLVAVDVLACGICGSDLHGWRHPDQSVAAGGASLPGIGGHEIVATVADEPGRRVVVEPNLAGSCGVCAACAAGAAWFCRNRAMLPTWGFSERMLVKPAALFDVPDSMPVEVAALAEPLACAIHGFRTSHSAGENGTLAGRTVSVVGAGAAGLLAVAAARALDAREIVCVARYPHQGAAAADLGATRVLDAATPNLKKALGAPDVVVEAVGGTADTLTLAMRGVRPGGEVIVLGLFDEAQPIDVRRAVFKELRMLFPVTYAVVAGRHDFEVALDVLAADTALYAGLATHRFSLDDAAAAFETAADKGSGSIKVVVQP